METEARQNPSNKYVWKQNPLFLSSEEKLTEYFQSKKEKLFEKLSFQNSENTSLLALLPSPFSMKDLQKAAQRILTALEKKESIAIFGDYDVDGTTSSAMLFEFFAALNHPVTVYIPDRLTEGYGLNPIGVEKLKSQGISLIITVDNGISAVQACQKARELGIDVIVTDHHDIPKELPEAFAILNPKQTDCEFPYKMLAGVGVAFYLMIAIRSLMREQKNQTTFSLIAEKINLKNYLDFVAIGTIADMAPLNGPNHILCRIGLEVLHKNLREQNRPGLYELLCLSGWNRTSPITASDVGFKIGPRLNAAGRLGNALHSVDLLRTKDLQKAKDCADHLHTENTFRQQLEKQFTQEAFALVEQLKKENREALVLHQEHWHSGVVGLVASRVVEKYYKPTLVFGTLDGKLKGSGRSTHHFNLFAALNEVRHEFISFGGHFHAVGLTLAPEKLPWLVEYLHEKALDLIAPEDKSPPLYLDGQLPLREFDQNFVQRLEVFEPYGIENPRSKWLVGPAQIKHVKRMGKDLSAGHAKILFLEQEQEFWLTAFGMADAFEDLLSSGIDVQLVIEAKRNVWNGREYVDLSIVDFAPIVYLNKQ